MSPCKPAIAAIVVGLAALVMAPPAMGGGGRLSLRATVAPIHTGQTYVPSLRLLRTAISGRVPSLTVQKLAILPFADYTHQQSFIRPLEWGANRTIVEALTDHFLSRGIVVALQEDVEGLLVADGLLRPPAGGYAGADGPSDSFRARALIPNTPEFELFWGLHDEVMREEIAAMVRAQDYVRMAGFSLPTAGEPFIQGVTRDLSRQQVAELGRRLDVDVIVRGRILDYGVKLDRGRAAVVQLRVYAQEARSGELFWSNRAEVEASAARDDPKRLLDAATREAVRALMADFFGER
jgi:hypothetical protein